MKQINICDTTMTQSKASAAFALSFREKIEMCKLLDRLGVNVIDLEGIDQPATDSLRIKSIAMAVKGSILSVPVRLCGESVDEVWNCLKQAKHARLRVYAAVSSVQMEYLFHKKPPKMLEAIAETTKKCRSLCEDVEFVVGDATRADTAYLYTAIRTAIEAGATLVTVCDDAGTYLPAEFAGFIREIRRNVPELANVSMGVSCANDIFMADACVLTAVADGIDEVKVAACPIDTASLPRFAKALSGKAESFGVRCSIGITEINRISSQIERMCVKSASGSEGAVISASAVNGGEIDIALTANDSKEEVLKAVMGLGYDLSDEDAVKVWESFEHISKRKEIIGLKELDAIVASAAHQVPETYKLETYVTTSSNVVSGMAQVKLNKNGETLDGASAGDGPIDAAFLAIEKITGRHFELDDFQIQAVTEGREAMGQTIVKLRSEGHIYSGRGISTDIIGSGIRAYINALNKIVYEEGDR